jgi:hypothetical protein
VKKSSQVTSDVFLENSQYNKDYVTVYDSTYDYDFRGKTITVKFRGFIRGLMPPLVFDCVIETNMEATCLIDFQYSRYTVKRKFKYEW